MLLKKISSSLLLAFLISSTFSLYAQKRIGFKRSTPLRTTTLPAAPPAPTNNTPSKTASLTLVSFENSTNEFSDSFQDLVQNAANNYTHCFNGYDKSVLLKRTWNGSTQPTTHIRTNFTTQFFNQLKQLAEDDYLIDIFIFTHGVTDIITTDFGVIRGSDIEQELAQYSGCTPIRMIYMMNCFGSSLAQAFIDAGAKTVVAPAHVNFYPNQYNSFARDWNLGHTASNAATRSNTASSRTIMQSAIVISSNTKFNFRKCIPGSTVLGTRPCAESYFTNNWLAANWWQSGRSGKDNMNNSSRMIVSGNGSIRKSSRPNWCILPTIAGASTSTPFSIGGINSGTVSPTPSGNSPTQSSANILATSGTVYSAKKAQKYSARSRKQNVTVIVKKTGGRARTTVRVYTVDHRNRKVLKQTRTFQRNAPNQSQNIMRISGASQKKILVEIQNHSATDKFQYFAQVDEGQN